MCMSGQRSKPPGSAMAMIDSALYAPVAQIAAPSSGSRATSSSGPVPLPTRSPSRSKPWPLLSPSPMTSVPLMPIDWKVRSIASAPGPIGRDDVAAAHQPGRRQGRRLGDAHCFQS